MEATLVPSARVDSVMSNKIKIIKYINRKGYKVAEVKDKGYGRLELVFENMTEANRCLDDKEGKEGKIIDFSIPRVNVASKGVVVDWDIQASLEEFVESLQDTTRMQKIERLRMRVYDKDSKKVAEKLTSAVVITWEGSNIPEFIRLYDRLVKLKVRPFIPSVMQCFKCFRYGHVKAICKRKEVCKVCGEDFHGRCEKTAKCVNCGGNHMANDKRYEAYRYNSTLKKTMAINKVSIMEARVIVEERKDLSGSSNSEERWDRSEGIGEKKDVEKEETGRRNIGIVSIKSFAEILGGSRIRQEEKNKEVKEKGK